MTGAILVRTLKRTYGDGEGNIIFSTFDCEHGRSHSFYVSIRKLYELLNEDKAFYDADMCSFLNAYGGRCYGNGEGIFRFRFTWLNEKRNGEVRGYVQSFEITGSQLECIVTEKATKLHVYPVLKAKPQKVKFDPNCEPIIHHLTQDKRKRRALCKAMRDQFNGAGWGDVILYADGNESFGFIENPGTGHGIVGGLIMSEYNDAIYGKKYYYSMNT